MEEVQKLNKDEIVDPKDPFVHLEASKSSIKDKFEDLLI